MPFTTMQFHSGKMNEVNLFLLHISFTHVFLLLFCCEGERVWYNPEDFNITRLCAKCVIVGSMQMYLLQNNNKILYLLKDSL